MEDNTVGTGVPSKSVDNTSASDQKPIKTTVIDDKSPEAGIGRGAGGAREVAPGVFEDPNSGMEKPQHYPAAVVITDSHGEDGSVKVPRVTPEEYNEKMNPADAKTNDSELVVHAPDFDKAQDLQDQGRSKLPSEAQDPESSSK